VSRTAQQELRNKKEGTCEAVQKGTIKEAIEIQRKRKNRKRQRLIANMW